MHPVQHWRQPDRWAGAGATAGSRCATLFGLELNSYGFVLLASRTCRLFGESFRNEARRTPSFSSSSPG